MASAFTLGELLCGILPRLRSNDALPNWPPDCFALCLSALRRTGAYISLLSDWPPRPRPTEGLDAWVNEARKLGEMWRKSFNEGTDFAGLNEAWDVLRHSFEVPLDQIIKRSAICEALIRIAAAADEASESVGAPLSGDDEASGDSLLVYADILLSADGTLCNEVDRSHVVVLPRMHTPQSGLTERSLSLYLSIIDPGEVTAEWLSAPFIQRDSFNLLLVPWPFEVLVRQFRDVTASSEALMPDEFGFFTYDVDSSADPVIAVKSIYEEAIRRIGRVDGVVFPEMALTLEQFRSIRAYLPQD